MISKEAVLFSCGIDSLASALLLPHASLIYFKANFAHTREDLVSIQSISQILERKIIIDDSLNLQKFETKDFASIFCRNLLFVTIASNYADNLYLGAIKGDRSPDKNPDAFEIMSKTLSNLGGKKVCVKSLLWNFTKTETVNLILKNPNGYNLLLNSRSCYSSSSIHCGRCGACFRRWVALVNNNIEEQYQTPPWQWEKVQDYIQQMKRGFYDEVRAIETFNALRKYGVKI
jgi:7-cyano-7-deazaguanine synthase